MMNRNFFAALTAACAFMIAWAGESCAQTTYSDDFTGAGTDPTINNQWYFNDGACLTAGASTSLSQPNWIPSCSTIWSTYYSVKQPNQSSADTKLVGGSAGTTTGGVTTAALDPVGSGALRFTNGYLSTHSGNGLWEDGSIISANTFNAGQGVQLTFKTVTYRGDSGGYGGDGADGIAFLLMDGSLTPGTSPYNGIGNVGGSLGYACSNINGPVYDGLVGAYIGLGIDEYGNFLHGAQLYPGYTGSNVVNPSYLGYNAPAGDNGQLGYGFHPNRIGLRGAGNVSWNYLSTTYPAYYPASVLNTPALQQAAVRNTCITGSVLNYSTNAYASCPVGNGPGSTSTSPVANCPATVSTATLTAAGKPALLDYAPIQNGYMELPSTVQIANESAMARPTGIGTNGNLFLYNLKITQSGLLSLSYSLNGGASVSVLKNQSITATNGPLPATLRFGFAGATGGSSNIHELLCFKAAPVDTSSSSSTTDQQQTGKLETTSQAYFAYYDPNDWTGRMTAYGLSISSTGVVTINSSAVWDSQCVLTGVSNLATTTCPTTGLTTPASAQPVATGTTGSRVMLTWNDSGSSGAGVPFEWPGSSGGVTTAEETVLDAGDATPINANRLNYLRGVRTNEINSSGVGLFRARDGVLSDIVDSSPTWVGPPSSPYTLTFRDRFFAGDVTPENTAPISYASFISNNQSRLNVVYVGANDGFLHGFRSGSEDVNGNVINNGTTPNDGAEVLAYMPGSVVNTIHNSTNGALDFANAQYGHNFFVDATPGTGDLFYQNAWHTWLMGGLGAGGADIYALDITDPSTASFNEGNAANVVKGDWNPSTITCANVGSCGNNLGNTYGTPLIRRFHNGMWGAIFGNGFGSASGDAGIFVMTVDQSTAAKTFYYLSTGTGSAGSPNGIAYVTAADLDGDHITDYVYAGDLQGNVWRFDLTGCLPQAGSSGSCTSTGWAVTPGPLFKTQSGQPITTPVVLASAQVVGANPVLLVSFGTGQRTQFTTTSATTYAAATQSMYGVWDWNFSTWNATSASQYASLSAAQVAKAEGLSGSTPNTLSISNLLGQTFSPGSITGTIDSSNSTVTWAQCGTVTPITCNGGVFGWYANLPGTQEQVVSSPTLYQQAFIVNSTVPAVNNPLSCSTSKDTGNTYIINVMSGGTFTTTGTTPTKTSGFLTNSDVNTVGQNTNETGALTVVNTGSSTYLVGQSVNPTPGQAPGQATQFKLPTNIQVNRVTWTQLR
jgi:type IV pilus assembly protein PilY1